MKQSPAKTTHRSLERGLALLEAVASSDRPASLADTARRLGLHRSTAHHLMQTLVSTGYLRQEKASRGYAITAKLYQLTGRMWSAEQLRELSQPLLVELSRLTGEGTSVGAWLDGAITIVAKQEGEGMLRVVQSIGVNRPMYCTAVGKCLAAWLPRAEVQAALSGTRMVRLTPKTITTHAAFDAELRRIRAAGYALDDEEQHEGLRCIAMPVFCYSGKVAATMCVLGPKQRMTHQKILAIRAPLAALTRKLGERLGAP